MLQMAKNKYSVETLRELNVSYDHEHGLTQKDVDMANSYVELIEQTRSEITPQIGDRLIYVTEDGDYYGNALIENLHHTNKGHLSICEQPSIPFVWNDNGNIRLSVSGGAFHAVNPKELKFLKWTETYAPFLAHHFAHIVIIYNSPISVSLRKSITFMIDMPSVFT